MKISIDFHRRTQCTVILKPSLFEWFCGKREENWDCSGIPSINGGLEWYREDRRGLVPVGDDVQQAIEREWKRLDPGERHVMAVPR